MCLHNMIELLIFDVLENIAYTVQGRILWLRGIHFQQSELSLFPTTQYMSNHIVQCGRLYSTFF